MVKTKNIEHLSLEINHVITTFPEIAPKQMNNNYHRKLFLLI